MVGWSAMVERGLDKTIGPVTLKVMVSAPLPAAQSVEPDWSLPFALMIASRKAQTPSMVNALSAVVLTTIALARAGVGLFASKNKEMVNKTQTSWDS
jgi:hypothetical protein